MVHIMQNLQVNLDNFELLNDVCNLVEEINGSKEYINELKEELDECNELCVFSWRLVERNGDDHRDLAGSLSKTTFILTQDLDEAETELDELNSTLCELQILLTM